MPQLKSPVWFCSVRYMLKYKESKPFITQGLGAMTIEITVQVPEELGQELSHYEGQLVEILERGLHEIKATESLVYQDESTILEVLASQPAPKKGILALKPSATLQARFSELLQRSKANQLSAQETAELERYLVLEHLVRLAKGHTAKKLDKAK